MYVNGELRREYDMREDRIEGLHTLYGDDRKAACILHYKDNDLQGYSYLGKDGNPVAMIPLKAGTGTVRCFYPDGTLSAELNFLNNLYDGRQKLYYSNGQLAEERIFSNADVNGPLVQYFKQGQVRYRAIYKDDELDGEENYFDQEGKLVKRTLYLNGYANGLQQLTDPATGQSTSIFYFYGTPVSVQ